MTPFRESFDPECTIWAPFAALKDGDRVDYWGAARPVIEFRAFEDGRVRILVDNGIGQDVAVAPGDTEHTWRAPREDEIMANARAVVRNTLATMYQDREPPGCCGHLSCTGEGPCGYVIAGFVDGSVRCDCKGK